MKSKTQSDIQNEFSRLWCEAFGKSPPLGHMLRHDFQNCWTRFHALPEAKRYAETDTEQKTILQRANALAVRCFGKTGNLWLATARYPGFETDNNDLVSRLGMTPELSWIDQTDEPEDQIETVFFVTKVEWNPMSFDWLFTEIAKDDARAIWFDPSSKTVLAPYDGGFDIISLHPNKITDLETKFPKWMSERSDRL